MKNPKCPKCGSRDIDMKTTGEEGCASVGLIAGGATGGYAGAIAGAKLGGDIGAKLGSAFVQLDV